jgi:hypothetical protein
MNLSPFLPFSNDKSFTQQLQKKLSTFNPKLKTLLFIEPYGAAVSLLKQACANGHQVLVLTANSDLRVPSAAVCELASLIIQVDTANDRQLRELGRSLAKCHRQPG